MKNNLLAIANKIKKLPISAAIISFNAEKTIKNTLESIKYFNEIIIVDNGSLDKTVVIGKKYTSKIYFFKEKNFINLRNFALKKIKNSWVFFIDTDEIITQDNLYKLLKIWEKYHQTVDGFWIARRTYYGKGKNDYLKHGLFYPDFQLRLFKKEYFYISTPHEQPAISQEKTYYCQGIEIFHFPPKNKLFSLIGFLSLIPFSKIHSQNLINQSFIWLFFNTIWRFFDLFFISLIRGKGILDGYYGILAAFNFSCHISLIYLYAIYFKLKKIYKNWC